MKLLQNIKKSLLLVFAAGILVFASCTNETSGTTGAGSGYIFPDATKTTKYFASNVYYGNGQVIAKVTTCYLEGWEDIPFLDLADVGKIISLLNNKGTTTKCENESDKLYSYTYGEGYTGPYKGDKLYFDVKNQTIYSDEFVRIISSPVEINNGFGADGPGLTDMNEDGSARTQPSETLPLIKASTLTSQFTPKKRTEIKLSDYGLKMFVIDEKINVDSDTATTEIEKHLYIPFQALANTFFFTVTSVFNGEDYYLSLDASSDGDALATIKAFSSGRKNSETRSQIKTEYNYRNICMLFDLNYCLKNQRSTLDDPKDDIISFNESIFKADLGFDLLSTFADSYDKAMIKFLVSYIDDGHTSYFVPSLYQPSSDIIAYKKYAGEKEGKRHKTLLTAKREVLATRNAEEGLHYTTDGKMAVVTFNGFNENPNFNPATLSPTDKDYYKNLASNNTAYFFKKAFEDIKAHPDVRNVVFDLTANGGGLLRQGMLALSFMKNPTEFATPVKNHLDGSISKFMYNVTFYGGTENVTKAVHQDGSDYHFYVLTSDFSFSCANWFPSVAKYQMKVPIIGKKSGGGAGVVKATQSSDGVIFQTSAAMEMCAIDGSEYVPIDNGVPVDLELDLSQVLLGEHYEKLYEALKKSKYANNFQ